MKSSGYCRIRPRFSDFIALEQEPSHPHDEFDEFWRIEREAYMEAAYNSDDWLLLGKGCEDYNQVALV